MKVFISTSSFAKLNLRPKVLLEDAGFQCEFNPSGKTLTREEIIRYAQQADGLIAGTEPLDRQVLSSFQRLKVISRCGAGLDNIDLPAASELGIKVFSTPDAPTLAVAELTVGLILALLRHIAVMDRKLRLGVWEKKMGNLLNEKEVGIIGFGRIGRKVAELLSGFGAVVSYCDPFIKAGEGTAYTKRSLDEILMNSDIITLHLPYSKENSGLLSKDKFTLIKEGAYLVNCSRAGIVDEAVLAQALKEGRLSGAAIDVFEREPYAGPLQELDNVILTPHVGSYAKEARVKMEIEAARNLIKGLKGEANIKKEHR